MRVIKPEGKEIEINLKNTRKKYLQIINRASGICETKAKGLIWV